MDVAEWVAYVALAAGVVCVVIALVFAWKDRDFRKDAKEAVKTGAARVKDAIAGAKEGGELREQAGYASALEALAKVATALKDLDRSQQYMTLALGFLAVAGVSAGAEAIGEGLADSAAGTT